MLKLANEGLDAIKGDCHLASAHHLGKQKWICHPIKGDHMVSFWYNHGILSIAMGESEYDLDRNWQIIAYDNEELYCVKKITFKNILTLLNWTCDDYLD